ncbi:conserved hypothetical protein [Thermoanaerobacter italicus Ab9]|uniref:Uncharacterized protein n=1 Tax=Thermoanaerobacter italicus (strain DSM 9252 / Ab9) TaxID=580331 RepID=D3T472_THEIA|nr:hypothetical protein [Thermoanaerobacter italicus]ADD03024.1 conserved hypothetical protein [Thermoanaerobacter italicus Ab9]
MPWMITFIVSWIILFLLIDWRYIKYTVWGGLLALSFQLVVDEIAIALNLYDFSNVEIKILNSSLFFTLGAPFCVGILYAQTYPRNNILRLINVFVLTALFFIMEYSLIYIGALKYLHWRYVYSLIVDVAVLLALGNLITIFRLSPWMRRGK